MHPVRDTRRERPAAGADAVRVIASPFSIEVMRVFPSTLAMFAKASGAENDEGISRSESMPASSGVRACRSLLATTTSTSLPGASARIRPT